MLIFHQGVSSTKAKKRTKSAKMCKQFNNLNRSLKKMNKYIFPKDGNSADFKISEQNPVSVKKKQTTYLIHSQLHQSAYRIPNESQGCAQQFLWFHIKPLHNVCANQVHQFTIYKICITYYIKCHTIQYRNNVLNRKKWYSIKYFRNISWDIYTSIISQNKIYPYLRNVPAVCPMFQ